MDTAQSLQIMNKSRTLRVTWLLIFILAFIPAFSLWLMPRLHWKAVETAALTESGATGWIIVFVLGSVGCVVLLVGVLLAFQNRKVTQKSRILTAVAVSVTLLLWGYWFYTTTARSVSAAPTGARLSGHSVRLTWKASTSPVAGYNIYRSTAPSNFTEPKLNSTPVTDTSFIDTTVESNKTYYYAAKAVDAQGKESPVSNVAQANIP
jgi:uncharacterized membrane protein